MTSPPGFGQYDGVRKELLKLIDRLAAIATDTRQLPLASKLAQLRQRVESSSFHVLIVGEFNAGKSTVVNAMLGEKVLPAHGLPTTAVLTIVRWGDANPPVAVLTEYDASAPGHIGARQVTIAATELEKYVKIGAVKGGEHKWALAEVSWPLELLRLGLDLVDSPGLNESPGHSRITLDHVDRADAVVFVTSALMALAQSERALLDDELRLFVHSNLFCLVNRINQVDEPEEAAKVIEYVRTRLRNQWGLGNDRVFFINARGALEGRRQGKPQQVSDSGVPEFEAALQDFLITSRARVKIEPPATQIKVGAADATTYIDGLIKLLDKDVDALNQEYERQKQPLSQLQADHKNIVSTIANHIEQTRLQVEDSARRMLTRAAGKCAEWSRDISPKHRINWNLWKAKQNAKAAAEEIAYALSERVMEYAGDWQSGELTQLLTNRADNLDRVVGRQLTAFVTNLEDIRAALLTVGDPGQGYAATPSPQDGTSHGPLLSQLQLLTGNQFGGKAMLKALLPQLGILTVLAFIGFGPGLIITAMLGAGAIQALIRLQKVNDKLHSTVTTALAGKLREDSAEMAGDLAGRIHAELDKQRKEIDDQMAAAIDTVHQQVQQALRKRDRTQQANDAEKARLADLNTKLADIAKRAENIRATWAIT